MGKSAYYLDDHFTKNDYSIGKTKYYALIPSPDGYDSCSKAFTPGTGLYTDASSLCCNASTEFDGVSVYKAKSCDTVNYVNAIAYLPFAANCDGKEAEIGYCAFDGDSPAGCNMKFVSSG